MALQAVSPLSLERYELKYRIPMAMVDPISRYVEQYCEMDYYSRISRDGFYTINSLYLDTPTLRIFRRMESSALDYSCFRIRSYGEDPKPPYYFESKQKIRDFCKKRRGKVPCENFADLFVDPWSVPGFDPSRDKNTMDFLEKAHTFGLEPFVLTQYRRRAYLSTCDDYARVTFDRDMRYYPTKEFTVRPVEALMSHYDSPDAFEDYGSGRNVILELKCERKIPTWMVALIRMFEVTHDRYSKYHASMIAEYGGTTERMAFSLKAHDPAAPLLPAWRWWSPSAPQGRA